MHGLRLVLNIVNRLYITLIKDVVSSAWLGKQALLGDHMLILSNNAAPSSHTSLDLSVCSSAE